MEGVIPTTGLHLLLKRIIIMKWILDVEVIIAIIGLGVAFAWALGAFEDDEED